MKALISILSIARMLSSWHLRSKLWWINTIITPLSIFIMLKLLTPGLEIQAIIGGIIALVWNSATNSLPQQLFFYKRYGLKEIIVASPINPHVFALGAALSVLGSCLAPAFVLVGLLFAHFQSIPVLTYLLLALIFTWFIGSMIGFFISGYATNPIRIGAITNTMSFLLIMMPPVYYPLETLPEILRPIAICIPTVALSFIAKIPLYAISSNHYFQAMSVILIYSIISPILAIKYYKWREK